MSGRRWVWPALLALALFGMFVGGLMTWHHDTQLYAADAQAGSLIGCEESAQVNCDVVNTSEWSALFGVPLGTWAFAFYALVGALAVEGWRGRAARLPVVAAGVGAALFSGFLYYVSTTELGYVCAWCLRLYATNAAILVLGLTAPGALAADAAVLKRAALTGLLLAVGAIGAERAYRGTLTGGAAALATTATEVGRDPAGPAPTRSFTVTTEDKREATFTLSPDDAWLGNKDAKVALVFFGDLECGYCKRSSREVDRLVEAYGDRVLFVFKHFPMNPECNPGVKNKKHRSACDAAVASVCAQAQGRFWAYKRLAYKNQHRLDADALRAYAADLDLDTAAFDTCVIDPASSAHVRRDAEVGASLDIHGTPRIFLAGKLYRSGTSAEAMARAIEEALGASAGEASQRAAALGDDADAPTTIPADTPPTRSLALDGLTFSIDTYEASVVDGAARSEKHAIPALRTSWYQAKAACEAAGRRLCTEEEWVSACQGARAKDDDGSGHVGDDMIEGTAYPYGDDHQPGRCWDDQEGDGKRPVYTGEMPGCVSAQGVYDLTGNVEEWVGATPAEAVLMGGAWDTSEDHARCYRRNDTFGAGYASPRTGFRCCGG